MSPIPSLIILISDILFYLQHKKVNKNYVKIDSLFPRYIKSKLKEEVYIEAKWLITMALFSSFYSTKQVGLFLLHPEWDT